MPDLRSLLAADRFAASNGVELVDVSPGRATARLALEARHLNGAGVVHGGALFMLADFTFAAAANSRGALALATSVDIRFLRPVRSGTLLAEAREEAMSRRLSTCTVRVTDASGGLVALFTGTAYRKEEPVPMP